VSEIFNFVKKIDGIIYLIISIIIYFVIPSPQEQLVKFLLQNFQDSASIKLVTPIILIGVYFASLVFISEKIEKTGKSFE